MQSEGAKEGKILFFLKLKIQMLPFDTENVFMNYF